MSELAILLFWAGAAACVWLWFRLSDRNDERRHERMRATNRIAHQINRQHQERSREISLELIEAQKEIPGDEWR